MRFASLVTLVLRELRRTRGALATASFGIVAGTAALVFFLALGLGVRSALFGKLFSIDQIELEPKKGDDPGLAGLVLGVGKAPMIPEAQIAQLKTIPGVVAVYPKLRFAFPCGAWGGAELLGRDVGTGELPGDGIEPALVSADVQTKYRFEDPALTAGPACKTDAECVAPPGSAAGTSEGRWCDVPSGATEGKCSDPIPALVSPYLVELFDRGIAPSHHLPAIARSTIEKATGIVFRVKVGESTLGKAKLGAPRIVRARIIGISPRAVDLGVTFPIGTVRRLNVEYGGETSGASYSSALVQAADGSKVTSIIAWAESMNLTPKDTRARDVSVLINGMMALLSLVAATMLGLAASNIAHTFSRFAIERRSEIGLYRALGASSRDMQVWLLCLAAVVGLGSGAVGVVVARLLALGADRLARTRLPDFPFKPTTFFAFPWTIVALGVGFATACAILGALLPARRTAKTDPAAALGG